jgi:tetratricopeptide (TPR) repeat protein
MRHHRLIALILLISLLALAQSQPTIDSLTTDYTASMKSKHYADAVTVAQQLVQLKSTSQNYLKLANAQLYSGAPMDALPTLEQAITAANAEKPVIAEKPASPATTDEKPAPQKVVIDQPTADWNEGFSKILIAKGNTLLKLHRDTDAIDFYTRAARLAANQGPAWFNVCAVLYNNGNTIDTAIACRKSIAADPSRANAYFILGSVLFVDAKANANGKLVITDEARNALNKYLELAPNGPHAEDVKAMLDASQ